MTKKKQKINAEDVLTFEIPENGLKKNIDVKKAPTFIISDKPVINHKDKFIDIKNAIHNLEVGKCLEISNKETGVNMFELQRKITNMVFGHKRKHVDKNFTTAKINSSTLGIWRLK